MYLKHSPEDEAAGIPAGASTLGLSEICHSHISDIRSQSNVAKYITKVGSYVTKDNQGLSRSWLADAKSGFFTALDMLKRTRPSAAQMINLMSSGITFYTSCYRKEVSVLAPDNTLSMTYPLLWS